jgi:hypothetical protein
VVEAAQEEVLLRGGAVEAALLELAVAAHDHHVIDRPEALFQELVELGADRHEALLLLVGVGDVHRQIAPVAEAALDLAEDALHRLEVARLEGVELADALAALRVLDVGRVRRIEEEEVGLAGGEGQGAGVGAMSSRCGATSKPRARRPTERATSSVVPPPQKGSTTRSPSRV